MDAEIEIHHDAGRLVIIKTPFDFSLTPDEAAEMLREFWKKTIVPLQWGLQVSSRITYREFVTPLNQQTNPEKS